MRIPTSKSLPGQSALIDILNQEFSGRYSSQTFGLGEDRSIMVRKSPFVGVQITQRNHELDIQATPPSVGMAYFLSVLEMTGLGLTFVIPLRSEWKAFEREIGTFLKKEYGTV